MKVNRQKVFDKYGGKCAYCGYELKKGWCVDHAIPQWRVSGGYSTHEQVYCEDNYYPSCASCNIFKGGNTIENFRLHLQRQPETLRRDRPTVRIAERFNLLTFNEPKVVFYFETLTDNPK